MSNPFYLVVSVVFFLVLSVSFVGASTPALSVVTQEFVSQVIAYDQVIEVDGIFYDALGSLGEVRNGTSRTGVELYDTVVTGHLNITNIEEIGNQTLSSINVTLNGTENIDVWYVIEPTPSYIQFNSSVDMSSPGSSESTSFFVSELRTGDSLIIGFNVTPGTYREPLNFTEVYSDWRVLTGRTVNITLNVTNNFDTNINIRNISVRKTPQLYTSDNGGFTSFFYSGLRGEDSGNANIFIDGESRTVLEWEPAGGLLQQGETRTVIFNSTAPQNISIGWETQDDWAHWMNMGNISAEFVVDGSVSGISVGEITAISTSAMASVSKERINESGYWNTSITLNNTAIAPLDYKLNQITLWATRQGEFSDPGNASTWINQSNVYFSEYGFFSNSYVNATWYPNLNFSPSTLINNYSVVFNYSYVPIVWMTADFMIYDDGNQIYRLNQTLATENQDYLFIEEIYVLLGGYLIKATKSIIPLESPDAHRYQINITLENIGTENTPELVTMFDLVPKDFYPIVFTTEEKPVSREMTSATNVLRVSDRSGNIDRRVTGAAQISDFVLGSQDTGEITSGPFQGYWGYNIDFRSLQAGSDGDGLYDVEYSESEILIRYKIEGNHSLSRIENAYIVGVDPIRLEGARPSQAVASRLSIMTSSSESIILLSAIVFSVSLLSITLLMVKTSLEVEK